MTQGEKMVWAAAYAVALDRRMKESQLLAADLRSTPLSIDHDRNASYAALDASGAVAHLRQAHARIPNNTRTVEHVEMLNEMLGIIVEPPLR